MRYLWVLLVVLAVTIMVGGGMFWNKLFGMSMSGTVSATCSAVGNWELTPDMCRSGDRRNFFGVQLFSNRNKGIVFPLRRGPCSRRPDLG
jgi:hypothetical protein